MLHRIIGAASVIGSDKRQLTLLPDSLLYSGGNIMAQDRITLPSGGAGLTRFSDVTSSKIEFSPGGVIVLTLIVMLIIVILHSFGKGWFGL